MIEAFGYEFFRIAIMTGFVSSIICGIIGSYVIVKHMVSVAGGLSHASFGGIGLGFLLGIDPLAGAFGFTVVIAGIIHIMMERARQHIDTLIGAFWAGGMAFGVLCISFVSGYTPDLFSYLFGNILIVSPYNLALTAVLAVVVVIVTYLLYPALQGVTFDPEYASILGVPAKSIQFIYLILTAVTIVVLIQVVGIILVIAMLTLPAAIARLFSKTLKGMMISATITGCLFTTAGIMLSWVYDAPSGSTIILLSVLGYLLAIAAKSMRDRLLICE